VTLTLQHLVNGAWASMLTADVPAGLVGGANVITANASAQEGFALQIFGDVNVFITNGATGPTVLDIGVPYLTNLPPRSWA
jgi:hypothetical protein